MTSREIRTRRKLVEARLKAHDAARKIIEAELEGLQHVCPHKYVETWKHYDYGGGCDHHWQCKDCGLQRVT